MESRPWRVRSRCPIAVATVWDGCLQRSSEVISRDIVDKYPFRTARNKVDYTGLPNDVFVNSTNFLSEGREITAFIRVFYCALDGQCPSSCFCSLRTNKVNQILVMIQVQTVFVERC